MDGSLVDILMLVCLQFNVHVLSGLMKNQSPGKKARTAAK